MRRKFGPMRTRIERWNRTSDAAKTSTKKLDRGGRGALHLLASRHGQHLRRDDDFVRPFFANGNAGAQMVDDAEATPLHLAAQQRLALCFHARQFHDGMDGVLWVEPVLALNDLLAGVLAQRKRLAQVLLLGVNRRRHVRRHAARRLGRGCRLVE